MGRARSWGRGCRMGWAGGVALLLACGCVGVSAQDTCEGAALAEYERCVGDCDGYSCDSSAFSGAASCDVVVSLGHLQGDSLLPAEGVWQMQCEKDSECALLRERIAEDVDCCPHGRSLSEYHAVCPQQLPVYTCSSSCAPSVLYFYSECVELYQNHTRYTALSNDGLTRIPLAEALETSAAVCRGTIYREGAMAIYAQLEVVYLPFAAWILLLVPFLICLVFVFFGRHLSSLFRMLVGAGACGFQIFWPAVAPFVARCSIGLDSERVAAGCSAEPPITADVVFDIAFAMMVALLAGYACRQMKNFGNGVQGFTLGFVIAMWTTDLWIGGITQSMDMDFVVLMISAAFGAGGATVNILFPAVVNVFGSSIIGSYCCCQLVCLIGYFNNWQATFPVSVLAASLGVAGCESNACYWYMFAWIMFATIGVFVQLWSASIERKVEEGDVDEEQPVTCWEKFMYELHRGFKILLDMERSIEEHAEFHSKDEMVELAERHAATWAAAATAASDVCLMSFGTSLVVNGFELLSRGGFVNMGMYIIFTGALATVFTLYEMQVHSNVTVTERVRQFDIYVWGILICVPFAATGFFVSLSLGLDSDPLGLHDDFSLDQLRDLGSDSSTADRTVFMRHMQVAAVAFFGLTFSACITCTVVCKNIGGLLYLMRKVHKFVSGLLIIYGTVIACVGFLLVPDETFAGKWIYDVVGGIGVLMAVTGLVGVIANCMLKKASEDKERSGAARSVMPIFAMLIFLLLLMNLFVFVAAGLWASNIHANVADDWSDINSTMVSYCDAQAARRAAEQLDPKPCVLTQDEFAAEVLASFQLAMAVGIVSSAYMFCGLTSAIYMVTQSEDTLSHADALVQKHAKEYLGALAASEKRRKHGKKSAIDDLKKKDAALATGKKKRKKKKKKRRVKVEQNEQGEWTAQADPPPPPPDDDGPPDDGPPPPPDDGFTPPPDGLPPPPPPDSDADQQVDNPLADQSNGTKLGGERVLTKLEKKALARQQKQLEKLQAQQKKLDERNAKAAAKRAAKKEKEAAKAAKKDKKGENDNSAMAAGATFDMEDAPEEAFADDDGDVPETLDSQVGEYQWVTDSDAETEYETDEEYHYYTTDSDPDDV